MHFVRIFIFKAVVGCAVLAAFALPCVTNAEATKYASLVIDADTGIVLHQENAGSRRYPASLTKMMTTYLAFQALESGALNMGKRLKVSYHASIQKPSSLGLRPKQTIAVRDVLSAIIIKSANDAAVVMAEALAGSEKQFAINMTRMAKRLGMKHTNYANASGLPDNRQVTTAYDQARLAIALRRDYPQYYKMFADKSFTYDGRTYYSHNRVTKSYRGADGLKTGYIRASGFNLVTSARRGDKSLVGVVLGGRSTKSRDQNMMKLLDQAFYQIAKNGGSRSRYAQRIRPAGREIPMPVMRSDAVVSADRNQMNELVSTLTSEQETYARNVTVNNDIPEPKLRRDIFSPRVSMVSYSQVIQDGLSEDVRPVRVKIDGKRVPIPTLRPVAQESGLVNTNFLPVSGNRNNLYAAN